MSSDRFKSENADTFHRSVENVRISKKKCDMPLKVAKISRIKNNVWQYISFGKNLKEKHNHYHFLFLCE